MPILHYVPFCFLLAVVVLVSVNAGKLTLGGGLTGGLIASIVFIGAGYNGLLMLAAFFIFGTATTWWKKVEKQAFKSRNDQSGKRNLGQVLANGGIAALAGLLAYLIPSQAGLFRLMMAASLSSAMADTLSSELGMIYGHSFYNIVSFKKDEKGLDGVVSLEGTAIGIAGSIIVALIYALGFGWNMQVLFIVFAGTIGNLSDSVLGALLERKHVINNDLVNFLNTLIAALTAAFCMFF